MRYLLKLGIVTSSILVIVGMLMQINAVTGLLPDESQLSFPVFILLFLNYAPAVWLANQMGEGAFNNNWWNIVLRGNPPWVIAAQKVLFGYALLVFFGFFVLSFYGVVPEDQGFLLASGAIFVVFAFTSAAIFNSRLKLGGQPYPVCGNRHRVPPGSDFCPKCGDRLDQPRGLSMRGRRGSRIT